MTQAVPGPVEAVRHVPDPAVVTAFAPLLADAMAVLSDWDAPDAAQERLRRDYLEHLARHPDAVAKAGPRRTSRHPVWCSTRAANRCC